MDAGHATDEELQAMADQVTEEIEAAVQFAEESPSPEPEDYLGHVFAEGASS